MGKTAKIVTSVLFVIIFGMLCWCIVQLNGVKQGMLFLTQQTAEEIALAQDTAEQAAQTAQQAAESVENTAQGPSPQQRMDELQQAQLQAMQEAAPTAVPSQTPTPSPSPEPTPIPTPEATVAPEPQGQVVYWVPNGGVWHVSQGCRTLANSHTILSGTAEESGKPRACKVCG